VELSIDTDCFVDLSENIKRFEDQNIQDKIREITDDALKVVFKRLEDPNIMQQIRRKSFESALDGLKSGKMTYANDSILPMIVEEVRKRTEDLKKLSPEEENKIFELNKDQRKIVAEMDHRAKIDYLSRTPEVASPSVKNAEVYKNIVSRIKRRIDASFKA